MFWSVVHFVDFISGCSCSISAHWTRPKEFERGSWDEKPADTWTGEADLQPGENGKLYF